MSSSASKWDKAMWWFVVAISLLTLKFVLDVAALIWLLAHR